MVEPCIRVDHEEAGRGEQRLPEQITDHTFGVRHRMPEHGHGYAQIPSARQLGARQ